ncbi:MAG: hypothetical protein QXK88_03045 [Desulfurococcaceae archaeon]
MLRKKDPLRKGFELLYTTRLLKTRVSRVQSRLNDRIGELSKRMLDLEARGEGYLAKRYAEEIAKLKELSRRMDTLLLVVDKVDLAIQHALVLKEFNSLSRELAVLLKDVTKLPESHMPDVGILFADLEESVRELSSLTGTWSTGTLNHAHPSDTEVKAILAEAREILRKNLEPGS